MSDAWISDPGVNYKLHFDYYLRKAIHCWWMDHGCEVRCGMDGNAVTESEAGYSAAL